LWRLHRVHHSDPHVDATTAIRGHPLESLLAYSYFSLIVLALGIDPFWLALRSLVAAAALAFHHSDLRLPARLDAALSWVTPTPRTHRLHHAREVRFTDSNYGTLFTWWDRLLGTFHGGQARASGVTGLNGFDSPKAQSVWGVLRSPLDEVAHDVREEAPPVRASHPVAPTLDA
jgi:sterol desaturase/sphingolipid hydroxylase (fatty acid hydroxylase superfamily)